MTVKTANVNSRMEESVKKEAEKILAKLGIPRSVAIDMYYRQIIAHNGIPFEITLENEKDTSKEEINKLIAIGLQQVKEGKLYDIEDVIKDLKKEEWLFGKI